MATFRGNITPIEIERVWELLSEGVGLGLIDFSDSTGFTNVKATEAVLQRADPIPPCRLAFLCPGDLAFGSVRMLVSFSAGWNIFRHREGALAWLEILGRPLLAA